MHHFPQKRTDSKTSPGSATGGSQSTTSPQHPSSANTQSPHEHGHTTNRPLPSSHMGPFKGSPHGLHLRPSPASQALGAVKASHRCQSAAHPALGAILAPPPGRSRSWQKPRVYRCSSVRQNRSSCLTVLNYTKFTFYVDV